MVNAENAFLKYRFFEKLSNFLYVMVMQIENITKDVDWLGKEILCSSIPKHRP